MLKKSALVFGCSIAILSNMQKVEANMQNMEAVNTIEMIAVVRTSCSVEIEGNNYISWTIETNMSDEQLVESRRRPFVLKFNGCQTGSETAFSLVSKEPVDDFCTKATPRYPDRPGVDAGTLKFCFDDESHNGIDVTTATKSTPKDYSKFGVKEDDSTVTIYAFPQFGDIKATEGVYYGEVTVMVKIE